MSKEKAEEKVDLLDRQGFIDQLIEIVERLAANKKNACFAINGEWGSGKSFVLEKFENELRMYHTEESTLSKYLVFHYNCWEYDYYEEPLIAIVAALLDQIDQQTKLIGEKKTERLKAVLKTVGAGLAQKGQEIFEDKTGINIAGISTILKESGEKAQKTIAESHKFDKYFDFKKVLTELSETIGLLSKDQSIIVVVDELDRCLPEYTIRVLERLHHVFDGVTNVQVILAVDKQQLGNAVNQIYGKEVSIERYLDKFIKFEVNLTVGEVEEIVEKEYGKYYDSFLYDQFSEEDVTTVYKTILKGIDIRACRKIVEKSWLCHELLNSTDKKSDAHVLCLELFLTILKQYGLKTRTAKDYFYIQTLFKREHDTPDKEYCFSRTNKVLLGLALLNDIWIKNDCFHSESGKCYINVGDIWGILLASYRIILGFKNDKWTNRYQELNVGDKSIEEYIRLYWKFLKIIK